MMGRAGPLLEERVLTLLHGIAIITPEWSPSECLFRALQTWNKTLAAHDLPGVADVATLSEVLAASLAQEGYCYDEMRDGHILAFAGSDLAEQIRKIIQLAVDEQVSIDMTGYVKIDSQSGNVVSFGGGHGQSAAKGTDQAEGKDRGRAEPWLET